MKNNRNVSVINIECEDIDFSNRSAINNILAKELMTTSVDYNILSVNISLTKDDNYLIVATIEFLDG